MNSSALNRVALNAVDLFIDPRYIVAQEAYKQLESYKQNFTILGPTGYTI